MSYMLKVRDGIYIDNGCTAIRKVDYGWFIPEHPCGVGTGTLEEYKEDIKRLREKWFEPHGYIEPDYFRSSNRHQEEFDDNKAKH